MQYKLSSECGFYVGPTQEIKSYSEQVFQKSGDSPLQKDEYSGLDWLYLDVPESVVKVHPHMAGEGVGIIPYEAVLSTIRCMLKSGLYFETDYEHLLEADITVEDGIIDIRFSTGETYHGAGLTDAYIKERDVQAALAANDHKAHKDVCRIQDKSGFFVGDPRYALDNSLLALWEEHRCSDNPVVLEDPKTGLKFVAYDSGWEQTYYGKRSHPGGGYDAHFYQETRTIAVIPLALCTGDNLEEGHVYHLPGETQVKVSRGTLSITLPDKSVEKINTRKTPSEDFCEEAYETDVHED